ncbi:MAG: hypothetical protein NDJ92_10490, partial [Thermoanaerobaculia bacterium]|nr:hypothetical protein [Thermoanaerobaculia bacterium]
MATDRRWYPQRLMRAPHARWARLLSVAIALILATLSAAGQSFPPYPPSWKLLYETEFDGGALGDFAITRNPTLSGTWAIVPEGANSILEGANNATIELAQRPLSDFLARFRLRLAAGGGLIVFFRQQNCAREWVSFNNDDVGVSRSNGCSGTVDFSSVGTDGSGLVAGRWSTVDVLVSGGATKVYVDGTLRLDASDPAPLTVGSLSFTTTSDAAVSLDDLQVLGPPQTAVQDVLVWTKTGGPPGGIGYDVRMRMDQPSRMYTTDTSSGVNVSDDNGLTWRSSNSGIFTRAGTSGDAIPIFTLTVDPHDPNVVWVGTRFARGLYKSSDAGATWAPKSRGITENEITFRGITIDPRNPRVIYAAAEVPSREYAGENLMGLRFTLSKGVVYRSDDGGENWTAIWRGDSLARFVWIDPRNSNVIYVSTGFFDIEPANADPANLKPGGVGILKSTDGGATWTALDERNGLTDLYLGTLEMNPGNPEVLLTGSSDINYPNVTSGLFITFDGGATWSRGALETGGHPAGMWNAVTYSPSDPDIAYAAGPDTFLRSTDMGKTWRVMAGGSGGRYGPPGLLPGVPVSLVVDPRNPNRVFQNNYSGGNFLTEDGGVTWQLASKGYVGSQLWAVAVDPTRPCRVYTGGKPGVFRSDDRGETWLGQNPQRNLDEYLVTPIAFAPDPENSGTVLIADESFGSIYRSTDAGSTRRLAFVQPGLNTPADFANRHGFHSIVFAHDDSRTVYAGMRYYLADSGIFRPSYGIAKSTDGGSTWAYSNDANSANRNINALAVAPGDDRTVYAATVEAGVLVSHDGGATWSPSNAGLPSNDVRALAIDPSLPA